MEDEEDPIPYEPDIPEWLPQDPYLDRLLETSIGGNNFISESLKDTDTNFELLHARDLQIPESELPDDIPRTIISKVSSDQLNSNVDRRKMFALTPLDNGYYEPLQNYNIQGKFNIEIKYNLKNSRISAHFKYLIQKIKMFASHKKISRK